MTRIPLTALASAAAIAGAHQLASLPAAAQTSRTEAALGAAASDEARAQALSPTSSYAGAAALKREAPALSIAAGDPARAATTGHDARRMRLHVGLRDDGAAVEICAAAPGGGVVACEYLDGDGAWYATGQTARTPMSDVARGIDAKSSYGPSRAAPIPGYSTEGW